MPGFLDMVQFSLRNSKKPMSNISQVHYKHAEIVNRGYFWEWGQDLLHSWFH